MVQTLAHDYRRRRRSSSVGRYRRPRRRFDKRRFLDLLRYFIVFEDEGAGKPIKKIAGYHQFHGVNVAIEETFERRKPARTMVRRLTDLAVIPVIGASEWSGLRRAQERV